MTTASSKTSKIQEVQDRIITVDKVDPYTRVLIQAPNKQGKTRFGASLPGTLVVDINERGTKSIRGFEDVDVFHAKNWADVVYAYWFLRASCEGKTKKRYKCYSIDTITQAQHVCMAHVLKEAEDRDPYRDPKTPTMRDWLRVAELMKPQILFFRNLPMHGVFLAQERSIDNEEGENERVPDLSPGSRGTLMAATDVIGRLFQKEVRAVNKSSGKEIKKWQTFMLVGPHERYPTGTRLDLPRVLRDPTMEDFINADRRDNHG